MNKKGSFDDSFKNKNAHFKIRLKTLKKLKKFNTSNSNCHIFNLKNISTINTSNSINNINLNSFFDDNYINHINNFNLNKNFYGKKICNFSQNLTPINKNAQVINFLQPKKSLSAILSPINKNNFSKKKANLGLIDIDINTKEKIKNEINTRLDISDYKTKLKNNLKIKSGIKIINNSPLNTIKNYNLFCKKNNKFILEAIKYHLSLYWDNKFEIINDFFKKNRMGKLVNSENIDNFSYYIMNNFHNIDFDTPMNNIIFDGIQYNNKILTQNKILECKIKQDNSNKIDINKNNDILNEKGDNNKMNHEYFINNLKKILNKKYKDLSNKQNLIYFNHQSGKIDTYNDSNLFINLSKQKKFLEKAKLEPINSPKNSIQLYNEKDLNELKEELNKINNIESNNKNSKLNSRLYYKIIKQFYNENSDYLPRKKHKLLEYIIFKNIKKKYNLQKSIEKLEKEQKEN